MATKNVISNTTDWNISTDIYNIVDSLNKTKKRYLEDEDETTLALGIFGYITDTEAKKIQTSTIMTGQLGNEMFPTRAKLTKNVLAHAIYSNIEDINAIPAHITINIGIKVSDFEKYAESNRFIYDAKSPLFIGKYEFHFDYDLILIRSLTVNGSYVYSAHYDMSVENRLSSVVDPYLKQPFVVKIGSYDYIIIQAVVRQCTIEETEDKIISDSIIENKTYTFTFENQLADFDVIVVDNGKETRLTPIPYGSSTDKIVGPYCWYLYITDNTVRITFDSKSYIPGLNSNITIKAYTTLGSEGSFSYKNVDDSSSGFYIDIESDNYKYGKVTCFMIAVTDSTDGVDRKTKTELQKLIPKAALSRGSITTETDVSNYFNLIDSEINRLVMQKKVDNQLSRIWYGYFLLKDEDNNIIPTNTITLQLAIDDGTMKQSDNGRYVLPAGSIISYNPEEKIGRVVDETLVPEIFSETYFGDTYYYMTIYNTIINTDPLYAAFYLTVSDKNTFFTYNWVNENSDLQFIATSCNFKRQLLTDQNIYKFRFKMAQSISADYGMYFEEKVDVFDSEANDIISNTIITNNMKCILILYRDGKPYRWKELNLDNYEKGGYLSEWYCELETDNALDTENLIKINDLHVAGYNSDTTNYGYFEPNTKASLYILAKFSDGEYGRYNLDDIAPGFDDYTVTNIYNVDSGLDFYENFTNVLDTKVTAKDNANNQFKVTGVPVVGFHYMSSERYASYLVDAIEERKAYIDYCLILLENSMNVDFKFFNTYGPSVTYTIGDKEETLIGHLDITLKFRVALKNASDTYTKEDLIKRIKDYIENLYETEDWHAPNMITDITNEFSTRIDFIEFMNYNDLRLGLQHILRKEVDDPRIVPEFINVRNRYNLLGELEPCIDIEIIQ